MVGYDNLPCEKLKKITVDLQRCRFSDNSLSLSNHSSNLPMGYERSPAVMVTAHPRRKEDPTPASDPRSIGFKVSYRPKYIPLKYYN